MSQEALIDALARCFLAGDSSEADIVRRGAAMLGRPWKWFARLTRHYLAATAGRTTPRHAAVTRLILMDRSFQSAWQKYQEKLFPVHFLVEPPRMRPVSAAAHWNLPRIETVGELADWFWLDTGELEWFADLHTLTQNHAHPRLRHYHCRVLPKESGGVRLIEAPKKRLKEMQRQILEEILNRVPAHPAAHGFVKQRSTLTFAAPHVGQTVVLRMDLQDFFTSFQCARVQTLFRTFGYPEAVADLLGGICTTAAPARVAGPLYSRRHLPQGAPSSPALANLCAYRLDCRLAGLAKAADGAYSRYADDLAFSGGQKFNRGATRFSLHVAAILTEEGLAVHHRKTRLMQQGVRQHLAGIVTNERLDPPRAEFDQLKATLTNCARLGPAGQNRDGHPHFKEHLRGKIAYVELLNPAKALRLRQLLERIQWTES